jgi:hypothetical protein
MVGTRHWVVVYTLEQRCGKTVRGRRTLGENSVGGREVVGLGFAHPFIFESCLEVGKVRKISIRSLSQLRLLKQVLNRAHYFAPSTCAVI